MEFFFAYLDAGSGALLIQVIVGGAAGIATFLRYRWSRMTGRGGVTTEPDEVPVRD